MLERQESGKSSMAPEEVGQRIKVTDEAVEACAQAYYTNLGWDWGSLDTEAKEHGESKAIILAEFRQALDAAVPHLQVQAGGDDGLREAIEREIRRASTAMLCNSDIPGWTMQEEVSKAADAVLALHSPEEGS